LSETSFPSNPEPDGLLTSEFSANVHGEFSWAHSLDVAIETAVLHDAVLEEAPPDSIVSGVSLAELAWFYDREQLFASGRSPAKSPAPQSAVDKLLATWP